MNQARYRIRGSLVEAAARPRSKDDVIDAQVRRLVPSRSRQSAEDLEVASDDVASVILDNGFELWTRTDDLIRGYGQETVSRDGGQAWDFDRLTPRRGVPTERGLAGLAIKALEFFGFDLKKETAANLAPWFEEKQFKGHEAGLYRCSLDDSFDLQAEQHIPDSQKPILVLLHGTASSVAGSFGKLW